MIELSPELLQRIEAQVSTGSFKEPSDVVRAALDMLELRQSEYQQLSTAIEQVVRGEYHALDIEDIKRRGRERLS